VEGLSSDPARHEALGIVEFFSHAAANAMKKTLPHYRAIGSQIGQFIKRRSAETGVRAGEERLARLFETSAAGMALNRLDGVFTAANPALQRFLRPQRARDRRAQRLELNIEDERTATRRLWRDTGAAR